MKINYQRTIVPRALALFLTIFILPLSLSAIDFDVEGISVFVGKAVILNGEESSVSAAPHPVETLVGVSFPMSIGPRLYLDPGLRFYGTTAAVVNKGGKYKLVPAPIEGNNRMWVLNIELRPEIGALFRLNDVICFGVTGAPVFTFRLPVFSYDSAAELGYPAIAAGYYLGAARFLGIYAGGSFCWDFSESFSLLIRVGTNLPVYRLWDGDEAAFYDQLIISPELGFTIRL